MNILLTVLAIIGGIFVAIIIWINVSEWLDSRSERRAYRKAKESFDYVARNIEGCQYWLNSQDRQPYREMFMYIVECMKKYNNVPASELRTKVDEIIKSQNSTQ